MLMAFYIFYISHMSIILTCVFCVGKNIRGLGNIPNKQARLPREWLAKPMLAKPLNDLMNFTLSYKVKCKKGVIFRRKRGGIE